MAFRRRRHPVAPSGFNKPVCISVDLCEFFNFTYGTELSRPDVTKRLTSYIKEHNLQNPNNKREIIPDKKLAKLLTGPTDGTPLTFFNLQRYIKHHFARSVDTTIHTTIDSTIDDADKMFNMLSKAHREHNIYDPARDDIYA